ncbi:DUF222 domain-containing protein [Actinoplanes sp. NPDC051851]|uniref:HNH endonuclease signature motif containing protein n=1 Tax=Actinoplanes sp. NPDC051851 TaxID=3154753 RepID=UPI0034363E81
MSQLREDAVAVAARPASELPTAEAVACLRALHETIQSLTAARSHLVRVLDQSGHATADGARDTAAWLRDALKVDLHTARSMVAAAGLLDRRPVLDEALTSGKVSAEQVRAIGEAVSFLPDSVGEAVIGEAELALLGHAQRFEPSRLRRLGERILEHVAPEVAERVEAESLRRAEQRAWWRRGLTLCAPVAGNVRITGCLTVEDAAVVQAALAPLCTPAPGARDKVSTDHLGSDEGAGHGDNRSPRQRRADALVEICRLAMRTEDLPTSGGQSSQVTVIIDYESLLTGTGAATTESGARVSAEVARRMACDAGLVPIVLNGEGMPLDLGRGRRLFSPAQRQAMAARDGGCAFPDCDMLSRWCDAHHMISWAEGGNTDVSNGVMVCRRHHRLVHEGGWRVRCGSDGLPDFIPPRWVDPRQTPQRNILHRPPVRQPDP